MASCSRNLDNNCSQLQGSLVSTDQYFNVKTSFYLVSYYFEIKILIRLYRYFDKIV